jgi:peptide/nickel transport system substrate-binding protein
MIGRGIAGVALCRLIATSTAPAIAPADAQGADTYAVTQAVDTRSGDPYKIARTAARNVPTNVYDALIRRDAGSNPVSGLATSWRGVYRTARERNLRRGVTFHDEAPLNVGLVRFSLDPALDAKMLFEDEAPAVTLVTAAAAYGMRQNLERTPRPDFRLKMFAAAPR